MASNKRRRLNIAEPNQPLSAFALRKKLLAERTNVSSSSLENQISSDTPDLGDEDTTPGATPQKSKRDRRTRGRQDEGRQASRDPALLQDKSVPDLSPQGHIALAPTFTVTSVSEQTPALSRSPSPGLDDPEEIILDTVQSVQLSSFKPSKNNFQRKKNDKLLLSLASSERLVILGNYGVRVDSGEITINGATLRPSKTVYWIDAPHCHALPVIRCADSAALELRPHPGAEGLRNLGRLSPLFNRLWNEAAQPSPDTKHTVASPTFQVLFTSGDGPKRTMLQDLVSPPEWNRELARILSQSGPTPSSIMVTGPKSSGKSTFGKVLANRILTTPTRRPKHGSQSAVAVLDLDPGQPEYCIAGQIALVLVTAPVLGPSFCHPHPGAGFRMVRSHVLASISPASDPELYLEAAVDLMAHYRNQLGSYPLIINTPGWIQGTGLDLLVRLLGSLRPSGVVYMSQAGPSEAVESLQEACRASSFATLPSQTAQYTLRTSAHLRYMQAMAYFHSEPSASAAESSQLRWSAVPLSVIRPLQVSYRGTSRGIFGIMCYEYQAPPELLADAINGTVLAAVEVESSKAFRVLSRRASSAVANRDGGASALDMDSDDDQTDEQKAPPLQQLRDQLTVTTPEGIPYIDTSHGATLDPRYSQSLGLVLVRGIDVDCGHLQLLTPISLETIGQVSSRGHDIVLISGKFDAPTWAYTEDLHYRSQADADDAGTDSAMDVDPDGVTSRDTDEDSLHVRSEAEATPWIEALYGNQSRGVGSKVWRVRRDLGKS
ncbi:hypothetical protein GGR56DRAFT_646782 [Xylariaceae sp. FL0804]|nr:hypothetical protein GGR56DRAFT_646782 [Xylariaceae sp. FL0804]